MMPIDDVPALFARLRENPTPSKLALTFLIACALRTQEAIHCQWNEIDLDKGLLVIPAPRMKMRREFRVPLSDVARDVLRQARHLFDAGTYAFPAAIKGSPLNHRAMQSVLRKTLKQPYACHGFRATFSTWAHERTEFALETIELSLAHVEGQANSVARAYNRGDAIEKRRALMNAWGDWIVGRQVSNVVPLVIPARA
jgi:integrase